MHVNPIVKARHVNSRSPRFPAISAAEQRWLVVMAGLVVAVTLLPFAIAQWAAAAGQVVFSGFLLNPVDGFTYLAKMRMGWQGHWQYHLPFTLEQGPGAPLFLFYFALGHLARWLDLPLLLVFHAARLACNFLLLWLVYGFVARTTADVRLRRRMWLLVALASGLGWLVQKFGLGYSYYEQQAIWHMNMFYVMFIAPHLSLAAALMLLMLTQVLDAAGQTKRFNPALTAYSWLLAIVLPYSLIVVYGVLGATLAALWWRRRAFALHLLLAVVCAGLLTLPLLLLVQVAIGGDPTLLAYIRQNEALSPSFAGMLLSFGLLLPFAALGLMAAWRDKTEWDILLLCWIAVSLVLMYLPYRYQWRFSAGLHIPIAMLAARGLHGAIRAIWLQRAVVALMLMSPGYLLLNLMSGRDSVEVARRHFPLTYLSRHEMAALHWMQTRVPQHAAVLASHEMGLFIPAYAGQRVVYGHVSETIDPTAKSQLLNDFFANRLDRAKALRDLGIDYVLIGPREQARARGSLDPLQLPLVPVFADGDVRIYKTRP